MKTIFQALRALRGTPRFGLSQDAATLAGALAVFESANRGHQNDLDDIALNSCFPHIAPTPQMAARARSFRETLTSLLAAALDTPKSVIPESGPFQKFWNMPDETGCLHHRCVDKMRDFLNYGLRLPSTFAMEANSVTYDTEAGSLKAEFTLRLGKTGLRATRSLTLPCRGFSSLAIATDSMRTFRRQAADLLGNPANWPEFSPAREASVLAEACRKRMADFLAGSTSEQREWYSTNWAQLNSPSMIRNAMAR